jgi:16S rRNA (cytosine967-C5)-methyltransferase
VALDALIEVEQGGRANIVVPRLLSGGRLEGRDRNLVTELVYGTCRMRRACDWLTGRHTRGPTDVEVKSALRLGAYQLGWTRIPPHAAVAATVEEVRGPGRAVVNAVLRRVAADVTKGLVAWPDRATEMSYPDWIVDSLTGDLGREAAFGALEQMNQPAAATHRADGYIQDVASQMVGAHLVAALEHPARSMPGSGRILDICAAPGGKATAMAGSRRASLVVASDLSLARSKMVAANVASLGLANASVLVADGLEPPLRAGRFELVLVDAPCSGLGVLRRRPDARWRVGPAEVDRLADLQRRLLATAVDAVEPGGILAYSVCTLTSAETASIDNWMARTFPDLRPLAPPPAPWTPAGRGGLLLPQAAGTDGMFLLTLTKPA